MKRGCASFISFQGGLSASVIFRTSSDAPQVKVSKHLAYLREHGMVETHREGSWVIYSLPKHSSPELTANMKCLQDCCRENPMFKEDLRRMEDAMADCAGPLRDCCKPGRSSRRAGVRQGCMRKLASECIGTFALVFAGTGAIVIDHASGGAITHPGVATYIRPDHPCDDLYLW